MTIGCGGGGGSGGALITGAGMACFVGVLVAVVLTFFCLAFSLRSSSICCSKIFIWKVN